MQINSYIDLMRATAIILMVAFHFVWDLNHFGYISTDIPNGFFWKELRAVIVSLFLFSVGVSLVYSYQAGISTNKLCWRLLKITSAAFLVTCMLYTSDAADDALRVVHGVRLSSHNKASV